jgi:hypothetical protein
MRTLKTILLGGLAPIAAIVMLAAASGASGAAAQPPAGVAPADRGNRPAEPAGTYMTTIVKQKLASEYGLAWQSLYPPHQRVATLDAYVGCESLVQRPGTLVAVKVLRVFNERIRVAGEPDKLMTRAVRVRVAIASPAFPLFPVTIVNTFHAIAVDGRWTWILSRDQYAYYSAGTCPYG